MHHKITLFPQKLGYEGVTKKPYKPIPIEFFKILIKYKKSTNILSPKHIQNGGPLKLISRLILTSCHFLTGFLFYLCFYFTLPVLKSTSQKVVTKKILSCYSKWGLQILNRNLFFRATFFN